MPQDSTTAGTLAGFGIGTAVMAILLPEFTLPYLAAAALVGGGTGAAVGLGVSGADDEFTNNPVLSGVGLTAVVVVGLIAVGAGIYFAHKYAP